MKTVMRRMYFWFKTKRRQLSVFIICVFAGFLLLHGKGGYDHSNSLTWTSHLSKSGYYTKFQSQSKFKNKVTRWRTDISIIDQSPHTDNVTERHLQLREKCRQMNLGNHNRLKRDIRSKNVFLPMVISTTINFTYCPVTKAGSTFFKRYIVAMHRQGQNSSPFDIDIEDSKASKLERLENFRASEHRIQFLEKSFKFVFTRDPYWRIFSTYVDKLYSPNLYYWGDWGQKAIKMFRLDKDAHPCGSGISFANLVKLVVKLLYSRDMHFIPMSEMCHLCDMDYDLVGKAEHAVGDIDYLADKLNISASFQHDSDYRKATAYDVIYDSTKDSFKLWFRSIKQCIGAYEMLRSIWRRLQIRGIIDADIYFPLSEEQVTKISSEEFRELCRKAATQSTDTAKLKKQKIAAFVEAYKTVDFKDLRNLQDIYYEDFLLLGYDIAPDVIFKTDRYSINTKIFDAMEEWK